MPRKRPDLDSLLLDRRGQLILGIPLLLLSSWILWVINVYLQGLRQFEPFDWFVLIVVNEIFISGALLAGALLISAAFEPPWIRRLIKHSLRHLNWLVAVFFACLVGVMLLMLLAIPVLMMMGILE